MLRLGAKTRMGLVVVFGVLTGLGLIVTPRVLSSSSNSPSPATRNTNSTSSYTVGPGTRGTSNSTSATTVTGQSSTSGSITISAHTNASSTPQPAGEARASIGSVSWLLALLVLPAVAISVFASFFAARWAGRARARPVESD